MLRLSELKQPQKTRITRIDGPEMIRLMEMGITPGLPLEIVRTAPLGYPIEIKIRGYLLSLREAEASCVFLEQV
ncbi:MAG TPA: FeoA family protein [Balneolales bacterium]|jgi:ferrous iron transport protein A|nr:FeoA family protein [Balneolales bacterium]